MKKALVIGVGPLNGLGAQFFVDGQAAQGSFGTFQRGEGDVEGRSEGKGRGHGWPVSSCSVFAEVEGAGCSSPEDEICLSPA